MDIKTNNYGENFTGKYSSSLCSKIAKTVAGNLEDSKIHNQLSSIDIGGCDDFVMDIVHQPHYNKYKYGINYKPRYSGLCLMETRTDAVFYKESKPDNKTVVTISNLELPFNFETLKKVTTEMISAAYEQLKKTNP